MPKYMFQGSYTAEGAAGIMREGGTSRAEETQQLISRLGGTVEAYYFAFGHTDFVLIADLPDDATAAAGSMSASSTGAITVVTTKLLEPSELDQAANIEVGYRAPGA